MRLFQKIVLFIILELLLSAVGLDDFADYAEYCHDKQFCYVRAVVVGMGDGFVRATACPFRHSIKIFDIKLSVVSKGRWHYAV